MTSDALTEGSVADGGGPASIPQRPTERKGRGLAGRWRLEKRPEPKRVGLYRLIGGLSGVAIALVVIPLASATDPADFYDTLWTGTLGTPLGLSNVLSIAAPLIIAGLAASIPYKLRLWNIGIDGQILIGAWAASGVAFAFKNMAGPPLIALMFAAGMLGGAIWILIPALARVYLGVSEVITTFLLTFVAVAWVTYWASGPWADPNSGGGLRGELLPAQAELELLNLNGSFVHWGLIVAVVLPFAVWAYYRFTRSGFELQIVGSGAATGRYAGIAVNRKLMTAMLVGGALGGLAGAIEMMGTIHQLTLGLTNNTGFNAVVIAVLAAGSPIGVLVIGALFATMLAGGDAAGLAGVDPATVFIVIGSTLALGALGEAIGRLRLIRTRGAR
ncbi:MAG: ral nucleoside transport system permease protein [Thermoleophilaceae bacterium]|jgi:simple sugar transport system permease protein|nr:ral nucleoside transport system permease protein [Thermoleophilaceae bacterium]